MSWVIWGAIILNLLGYFMDATWTKYSDKPGYFSYNIGLLSNFPYWLFATLTFFAANGFASLYFARFIFQMSAREGDYQGGFPLPHIKLLGINLMLIPALLVLFIIFRAISL
jgi:hypothetical protein